MNKNLNIIFVTSLLLTTFSLILNAQELKRKAFMGIETIAINHPESICSNSDSTVTGICVKKVAEGFTAANLGIMEGDIIVEINNYSIKNSEELQSKLKFVRDGDPVEVVVLRKDKKIKLKAIAVGRPYEKSLSGEVIYDQTKFLGGQIRLIINKPTSNEKMPAILFIQGYPCSSVDNLSQTHPYKKLIEALVAKGIVVMRAEKPGMGDCLGTPNCYDIDIITETNAFTEAYKKLKTYDFVDTSKIFIFGHSLGGISAPIVASSVFPKGVIVYGTTCEPWYEYLLKMLRYQNPLFGTDFIQAESEMKVYQKLLYEHFILKKSPSELCANPEYCKLLKRDFEYDGDNGILGRIFTFWFSVNELNLTEYWAKVSSNVLAVYGEADIEALEPEPTIRITDIVNHYHPGKATFYMLPGTDHAFLKTGNKTEDAKLKAEGKIREYYNTHFNYEFCDYIINWMNQIK